MSQEPPFAVLDNYRGFLPIQVFVNYVGVAPGSNNFRCSLVCCKGESIRIPFPPKVVASTASFKTVWYRISGCDHTMLSESSPESNEPKCPGFSVQRTTYKPGYQGVTEGDNKRHQIHMSGDQELVSFRNEVLAAGASMTVAVAEYRDGRSLALKGVERQDRLIVWVTLLFKLAVEKYLPPSYCAPFRRLYKQLPQLILTVDRVVDEMRRTKKNLFSSLSVPRFLKKKTTPLMTIDVELLNPLKSGVLILTKEQSMSETQRQILLDQRLYLRWTQIQPNQPLVTKSCFQIYDTSENPSETSENVSEPLCYLFADATWNVADVSPVVRFSFSYKKSMKSAQSNVLSMSGQSLEIQTLENMTIGLGVHMVIAVLAAK